jgi:DNA-binding MarR family transcriptional regulator
MTQTAAQDALRELVQRFVRGFGLLSDAQTPCGRPLRTSHAHALMILLQTREEGLHQAALARQLGVDKSNASRLVRQLAQKGQVAITKSPDQDARKRRVRLTAKGVRLATGVDQASRERFAGLLRGIEGSRRPAVLDGLAHLVHAIERTHGSEGRPR